MNRAAVISVRGGHLLVIRRLKDGRRYAVLPGGGVEPYERAGEAALRELQEETGLSGELVRHLCRSTDGGRVTDYFLVVVARAPMTMSGPEVEGTSIDNVYEPCWIAVADLDAENLQPAPIGALVRELAGSS